MPIHKKIKEKAILNNKNLNDKNYQMYCSVVNNSKYS